MILVYNNCMILMPFSDSKEGLQILLPNVEHIPNSPIHYSFTFFTNGIPWPFEYLKQPQVFNKQEPYAIAVPSNPNPIFNVKLQEFLFLNYKRVLPNFSNQTMSQTSENSQEPCTLEALIWQNPAIQIHPDVQTPKGLFITIQLVIQYYKLFIKYNILDKFIYMVIGILTTQKAQNASMESKK